FPTSVLLPGIHFVDSGSEYFYSLDLAKTDIDDSGASHIEGLGGLRVLSIAHTNITEKGVEAILQKHVWLSSIDLTGVSISNHCLGRAKGSLLESIVLRGTPIDDSAGPHLATRVGLASLDLSFTGITNRMLEDIGKIRSLKSLRLAGTRITDGGLKELAKLSQLISLDLN